MGIGGINRGFSQEPDRLKSSDLGSVSPSFVFPEDLKNEVRQFINLVEKIFTHPLPADAGDVNEAVKLAKDLKKRISALPDLPKEVRRFLIEIGLDPCINGLQWLQTPVDASSLNYLLSNIKNIVAGFALVEHPEILNDPTLCKAFVQYQFASFSVLMVEWLPIATRTLPESIRTAVITEQINSILSAISPLAKCDWCSLIGMSKDNQTQMRELFNAVLSKKPLTIDDVPFIVDTVCRGLGFLYDYFHS